MKAIPHHVRFCARPVCDLGIGNRQEKGINICGFPSAHAAKQEAKRLNKQNDTSLFHAVRGHCPVER